MDGRRNGALAALVFVLFVLAGCVSPVRGPMQGVAATPPTESGPTVANHLQSRYDDTSRDCRGTPAVLCSGVLMRGTTWSTAFHSWIPNPSTSAGGVSFSWLRQDSNFVAAAYPNGFIVYPHFYSDDPYFYQLVVNCGYVVNAGTGSLADKCRVPCHRQNIFTSAQWLATFPSGAGCAFKIAPGDAAPNPADAWMQIVNVRQARNITTWNEILVATWPQNTHVNMPLEAFFYTNGSASGRSSAQNDQRDFRATAGRWVPVIRWTPATSLGGRARFEYNASDQAITQ
ncbi:hypothetical protein P3W33_07520 [Luteibacter sp. PPL552]|jgi:hypothetical protein